MCIRCWLPALPNHCAYIYDGFHWKCYLPKIHQIEKPKFLVHIRTRPTLQFEFVPRGTEESEFLDVVAFGGVAISVETVICNHWCNHCAYGAVLSAPWMCSSHVWMWIPSDKTCHHTLAGTCLAARIVLRLKGGTGTSLVAEQRARARTPLSPLYD